MSSRLLTVAFDAQDPARLARFWAGLLNREIVGDGYVPGKDKQPGLRFVPGPAKPARANPLHLHLTSGLEEDQQATVAAVLRLGGRHLDVGQLPDEDHVVLADPEGNEFCVLEPGNSFVAGCGYLGEVTCDGTRAVGRFWSEALGWPLVWDSDGETAIQSPDGGTKVSWSGTASPKEGRNRLRLELVVSDVAAEVDRLIELGVDRLGETADGAVELADPDGNEFTVRAA